MTTKEFIYNKYPHLKRPIEGKNPIIDFELNTLCQLIKEYAEAEREKAFKAARETDFDEDSEREEYIYVNLEEYKQGNPLT